MMDILKRMDSIYKNAVFLYGNNRNNLESYLIANGYYDLKAQLKSVNFTQGVE